MYIKRSRGSSECLNISILVVRTVNIENIMKNTKRKLVNNELRSIEYLKYANKVTNIKSKKNKKS